MLGWAYTNDHWAYIPIPKCASTSMRALVKEPPDGGIWWRQTDEWKIHPCPLPAFVVVRNPVERFFSGVLEHAITKGIGYDWLLEKIRTEEYPVLDAHTQPQSDYVLSTYPKLELVALENLGRFVEETFGWQVGHERKRNWVKKRDMIPWIQEWYREDMELWARALE